ncbi:MAG: dTMP kinase [Endozoicomonadaceae bacterium]|nr:dTMP kinase [Endozoicomonadaceae bacterium]
MQNRGDKKGGGYFITVEGSEGSGKTTCIQFIQQWLVDKKIDFITTREPGGTGLGEQLRDILLDPNHKEKIDEMAELLIIFASRRHHLSPVIKPALQQNKVVVCDRFTDSTWAYQGGGRQMNPVWIGQLEQMVQNHLRPDLTIFLDVPVTLGLQRAKKRSTPDRFEQEDIVFFQRIREAYLKRAEEFKQQYKVIDASQSVEQIHHAVIALLSGKLNQE